MEPSKNSTKDSAVSSWWAVYSIRSVQSLSRMKEELPLIHISYSTLTCILLKVYHQKIKPACPPLETWGLFAKWAGWTGVAGWSKVTVTFSIFSALSPLHLFEFYRFVSFSCKMLFYSVNFVICRCVGYPSILFKYSHVYDWIIFHFTPLSTALSPFPLLFLRLSPLIYLNHPPGENRSPPQSGTNCFVRFMNPEPNPRQKNSCKDHFVICFCSSYRLCCVPWMQRGPGASQHIKAVTNMERKCCGHKWNKPEPLLIRSHL